MTTAYNPSLVPVGPQPIQVWAGITGNPIPILFNNNDQQNTVNLGYQNDIAVGGTNTVALSPLTSISLDGSRTIYAVAPAGTQPLQVVPGGSSPSSSPVADAEAIIESGLALSIAEAIAGTGLPLIGSPTILYNLSSVPPASGASLVGNTIPNQAFNNSNNCYDSALATQAQADSKFVSIVGRGNNGHLTCTKKYWGVSHWETNINDVANYAAFGTTLIASMQPLFYPGLPAGSNFTTAPGLTNAQKAAAAADVTSLTNFITAMLGLGFTTSTLIIVLWQEPGVKSKGMSPTDFENVFVTYGPAVNASGCLLVADIDSGIGATAAISYANAAIASGVPLGGLAQDLYLPTWVRGNIDPSTIGAIADANSLPYGLFEIGCAPNNFGASGVLDSTHYLLGQFASGGNYGVLDYMQHRLQTNKPNLPVMYYDGDCSPTGASALSSPIGQDPSVTSPDFRIGLFQQLFDTLTSVPTTAFTVAANSTVTVGPATPSAIGGLAMADFLSYEISIGLIAGAASTNPFVGLSFVWFDFDQLPKNQNPVSKEVWHIPMGTNADPNGPLIVYGSGRMHGAFMQLKINNQDTVACTVQFLQVVGTSRTGQRSTLTWYPQASSSPQVPGFTLANSADQSLQVGAKQGFNVGAGGTADFLCGLFAGQAYLRVYQNGAAGNGTVNFTVQTQPSGVFTASNLFNEVVGNNNPEIITTIALPRGPVKLHCKNNDANAVTIDFELIGIETA